MYHILIQVLPISLNSLLKVLIQIVKQKLLGGLIMGMTLFVRDEGEEYLIQTDELAYWSYRKEIIHTADLDNDGVNEAIVEASDGGGHGKIKYFIISKRGENFYSVYESNNFDGMLP